MLTSTPNRTGRFTAGVAVGASLVLASAALAGRRVPGRHAAHSHPAPPATPPGLLPAGKTAPGFTLSTVDGESVTFAALRKGKKATLLNFWFRNCDGCREELPHLRELHAKLGKRGLQVVGINCGDDAAVVRKVTADQKLTYPTLLEPDNGGTPVQKAYGVSGFPANFLIDARGKIVYSGNGWDEPSVIGALQKLGLR